MVFLSPERSVMAREARGEFELSRTRSYSALVERISGQFEAERPRPEEFVGLTDKTGRPRNEFSRAAVEADLRHVLRLERVFAPAEQMSGAAERALIYYIEQNNWFGEKAVTTPTSKYDDYVNAVDAVVEWKRDGARPVRLAVDFTTTLDPEYLQKKTDRLKGELDRGTLATMKYFKSAVTDFRGPIYFVPRIILGVTRQALVQYLEKAGEQFGPRPAKGLAQALAEHPLGKDLLAQAREQLEWQRSEFEAIVKKKHGPTANSERALAEIGAVLNELPLSAAAVAPPSKFREQLEIALAA